MMPSPAGVRDGRAPSLALRPRFPEGQRMRMVPRFRLCSNDMQKILDATARSPVVYFPPVGIP
jgi:hypothetical protein